MNEQQGGLNQVSQAPPPNQANQPVQPAPKLDQASQADQIASENLSNKAGFDVDAEMSKYRQGQNILDMQIQKMQEALTKRMQPNQGLNYDPKLLALGIGMAQPTKTGNFFESLGQGASAYNRASQDELTGQSELMGKQVELQKAVQEERKRRLLESASSSLYKKVKDPYGEETFVFDPNAAQRLTQLSGDPKYVAQIVEQQKKTNIENAYRNMFTQVKTPAKEGEEPTTSYQVNPTAVRDIFRLAGPKDALEFIKAIPEMRKAGLLGDRSTEGTPFDALAMMAQDPAIRQQAVLAAQRYKSGLIKEEDADKLANQMLTMMTSHMDRQSALAQAAAVSSVNQSLAQQRLFDQQQAQETKKNLAQQTQKQAFDTAQDVINQVNLIKNHPGRMNGLTTYNPAQLVRGTNSFDFMNEMEKLKSQTFLANVQSMRGLGALSNKEGDKITDAIAKLNPGMSKKSFDNSLVEINKFMVRAQQRAKDIAEGRPPVFDEEPASPSSSGKSKFKVVGTEPAKAP